MKSIKKSYAAFLTMKGNNHIIKWILIGFVSLIIILFISYALKSKDSDSKKMANRIPMTIPSDKNTAERNRYQEPAFNNFSEKSLKDSNALGVKEKANEFFRPKGYAKTANIVKGVGLSEGELKALHRRQDREIELMSRDLDSIVTPPAIEGEPGITLGELLALHEQQRQETEKAYDRDEIVIPASEDGSIGLSRNELTVLHEQQERELQNSINRNEIVIPATKDGYPGISREKLTILQEQQNYEIWEGIDFPYEPVAPPPKEGGPNLTVFEINELHERQSIN